MAKTAVAVSERAEALIGSAFEFRWGVSRGRDTYGYTICSLYVNGKKRSSCNGGNYDMKGVALGNFIAAFFREELCSAEFTEKNKEARGFYGLTYHDPNYDPGKAVIDGQTVEEREKNFLSLGLERYQAFYGDSAPVATERHTIPLIDGMYGFSSVERILKALGLYLRYVTNTAKTTIYILERIAEEVDQ